MSITNRNSNKIYSLTAYIRKVRQPYSLRNIFQILHSICGYSLFMTVLMLNPSVCNANISHLTVPQLKRIDYFRSFSRTLLNPYIQPIPSTIFIPSCCYGHQSYKRGYTFRYIYSISVCIHSAKG